MARKKVKYDKKGLVRQITGSIFSQQKPTRTETKKWRPRSTKFERLDGEMEEIEEQGFILQTMSVESELRDYRRDNPFEKKKEALKKVRKRGGPPVALMPSARDTGQMSRNLKKQRVNESHTSKRPTTTEKDPFAENSFDHQNDLSMDLFHSFSRKDHRQLESFEDASSRHSEDDSKKTFSTGKSAFDSINSDPTDFFSKPTSKLTMSNVEAMNANYEQKGSFGIGIENINPRNQFHQFSIDEDKESTVILPVGIPEDFDFDDDESEASGAHSREDRRVEAWAPVSKMNGKKNSGSSEDFRFDTNEDDDFFNSAKDDEISHRSRVNSFSSLLKRSSKREMEGTETEGRHVESSTRFTTSFTETSPTEDLFSLRSSAQIAELEVTAEPENKGESVDQGFPTLRKDAFGFPVSFDEAKVLHTNEPRKREDKRVRQTNTGRGPLGLSSNKPLWPQVDTSAKKKPLKAKQQRGEFNAFHLEDNGEQWDPTVSTERSKLPGISQEKENKFEAMYRFNDVSQVDASPSRNSFSKPWLSTEDDHVSGSSWNDPQSECPIGIQRFSNVSQEQMVLSAGRLAPTLSYSQQEVDHNNGDLEDTSTMHSSRASRRNKPLGLPNNAIMASMLFQRHHNIDTRVVDEKLKAKEAEYSQFDKKRGDIPASILANEDTFTCVSSFSEDTRLQERWTKPTRDLLQHFSRNFQADSAKRVPQKRSQAAVLFEA